MIKELIKDISYDNISLAQALTRAKLIAYKIDNTEFKDWLNCELNGYSSEDQLPDYRSLRCDTFAQIDNPYYGTRILPIDLSTLDEQIEPEIYIHHSTTSINNLEKTIKSIEDTNGAFAYVDFPIQVVSVIREMTNEMDMSAVRKRLQLGQLENIINMTKQKLLDTLLELNDAFPNMENDFMSTDENEKIASQIITTNIYGNNASSNVGVGKEFTQGISNSYTEKVEQVLNHLRELGVPNEDIQELQTIIENESDKTKLGPKFLAWSSKLATKAMEKGIDHKVPEILDAIQGLF